MKAQERTKARELRSGGQSIKQIARQLGVSKGSVSLWVQDICLSPEQLERLAENGALNRRSFGQRAAMEQAKSNHQQARQRHEQFLQQGYQRAQLDSSFRVIAALYWGEGNKMAKEFRISNSDPSLLDVVMRWLIRSGYDALIRFSVRYHPNNGITEEDVRRWWMNRLPLLREDHLVSFRHCSINRASQQKLIGKLPYGTAHLAVHRTELYYNIMGGIDFLRQAGA